LLPVAWDRLDRWWPWLIVISAVHAGLDAGKVYLEARLRVAPIIPFLADQALHVATLGAVTATFPVEFWAAISLTATLGWSLRQ